MLDRALALRNVKDTLAIAMEHDGTRACVLLADERSELSRALLATYVEAIPNVRVVLFDENAPQLARAALDELQAGDLAVLVQSSVFRMPDYRIRVELYKRDVKVMEHSNLDRMIGEQVGNYFAALAYDPAYYRTIGHALQAQMNAAQSTRIESGPETLVYDCPLESAKLNIGHFADLKNFGSQFPIGEVFTEATDLERVNGRVQLYGFTDTTMRLNVPDAPITMVVERGRVTRAIDSTSEFDRVLERITSDEGEVWIRELGFGMNRALSKDRRVNDVGAFERVCGVHISLGARHGVYRKPHIKHREARYHVDSFVVTKRVLLDDRVVYDNGAWCP